ncbi:MAG: PaaI family thioesterase [Myxococcota bacterium]|nr:PaaI family thioesterase [Myxococcota bacterium]
MKDTALQDHYSEVGSHCYGCGRRNEHGLHIKSYWDGDETVCHFKPRPYHTAFKGYVYGGLLASLIDCHGTATAAMAAYRTRGQKWGTEPEHRFVTASLRVDYRKPTPIDTVLELRGFAKEVLDRKTIVSVKLFAQNQLCVIGEVIAVPAPPSFATPKC